VHLSPRWVRIAVPAILGMATLLTILAALVHVPSYSRGTVVVTMNGSNVISNASGRITKVLVMPGQHVSAGDPLIILDATRERADFEQIDTIYRNQLSTFLFDTTDEAARQSLAGILAQRTSIAGALTAKTIAAPIDGVISTVLVTDSVNLGEQVATIIPAGSEPSVVAFMPGSDLSRIKKGMLLRLELVGYQGVHEELEITDVGTEIIGPATARKVLGQKLADAVPLPPSIVIVKARLPAASFESAGKTYSYFDGMEAIGEIEVDTKSFLSVVIPTGE
jgi:membrane fusion protein (multidrug efflux system)